MANFINDPSNLGSDNRVGGLINVYKVKQYCVQKLLSEWNEH